MKKLKGFIEVEDVMLNKLIININEIQILYMDSKIRIKGFEVEIELNHTYEEIKQLIKNAQ